MQKVLILTYYWPPASGPGVQRFLKFCKYLPEFGWKPYVITVENGTYSSVDETLAQEVPAEVSVTRTRTHEPFALYNRLTGKGKKSGTVGMINMDSGQNPIKRMSLYARANYFIPDARKGWNRFAYKAAKSLIEKENIGIVITTGPPHSTHLVGYQLKQKLGVKWLADFRDPWINIFYNETLPRTAPTMQKDKALEDKVLQSADSVVVVSDGLREEFADRTDATVIYNGFDNTDLLYQPWNDKNRKFTLAHVGNFMPGQNIETLWQALKELSEKYNEFGSQVKLSFTGNVDNGIWQNLEKYGLDKMTENNGYVAHQEATRQMMIADLLLFVIPRTKRNHLIITGKLFEYIASRTPILGIGPTEGNAANILQNAHRHPMLDFDDLENIKKRILVAFTKWQEADAPFKHDEKDLENFSRKGLTGQLSGLLDEMSKEKVKTVRN